MSNVDVGSSLKWLPPSALTLYHHFDSTSDPEPQNMTQVVWVQLFKAATLCPWTAYECAQTISIHLMWTQEEV